MISSHSFTSKNPLGFEPLILTNLPKTNNFYFIYISHFLLNMSCDREISIDCVVSIASLLVIRPIDADDAHDASDDKII